MLEKIEIEKLIEVAKAARQNAFVFRVGAKGAAVLTTNGEYYGGCNVEGIISSQGDCAEVSAIYHAVNHGNYEFKAIAIVDDHQSFPCGSCLQFISLFSQINDYPVEIVVSDLEGNHQVKSLAELLPHRYLTTDNLEKIKSFKNKCS